MAFGISPQDGVLYAVIASDAVFKSVILLLKFETLVEFAEIVKLVFNILGIAPVSNSVCNIKDSIVCISISLII